DERVGNDVQQKIDSRQGFTRARVLLNGRGIESSGVHVHASAGLDQGYDDEAGSEREGGNDFEIKKCLDADAAELAHVADVGHAGDDGAKDDWRDHHADQLDEAV